MLLGEGAESSEGCRSGSCHDRVDGTEYGVFTFELFT